MATADYSFNVKIKIGTNQNNPDDIHDGILTISNYENFRYYDNNKNSNVKDIYVWDANVKIEDIKEKADFVTDDNNHNGIAKALKKFVI